MCSTDSHLSVFSSLLGLCHSGLPLFHLSRWTCPSASSDFIFALYIKTPVPVWWKICFTLPSLTSMGLMVLSSTCSSVVLIEAHRLDESSPKICSLFLTVTGFPGRPLPARIALLTIPVLSLAGAGSPGALFWLLFSHQVLYFWPPKPSTSFQFVLSGD